MKDYTKFSYRFVFNRKNEERMECLIQLEIYNPSNRRKCYCSTNVKVAPDQWDKKHQLVINRNGSEYLNVFLYQFKNNCEMLEMDYRLRGIKVSITMLKNDIKKKKKSTSGRNFYQFVENYIQEPSDRKKGTIDNLWGTLKSLKKYKSNVSFDAVDVSFLNGYEKYLVQNGICVNTIVKHITNLKLFVNQAIANKYIHEDENPFKWYKPKSRESRHRALSKGDVEKIEGYKPTTKHMEKIRDAFLFCIYTGFRFSDFVTLSNEHFSSDNNGNYWIKKKSVKTGVLSLLPISKLFDGKPVKLLQKYNWEIKKLNKIGSNSEVNRDLKEICKTLSLKLNFSLSWHVSRHTFATLLIEKGVAINVVSKMLGHTSVRMSETYCETTDTAIINSLEEVLTTSKKKKL